MLASTSLRKEPLAILLIAGQRLYQDGLGALLSSDPRFDVWGTVPDVDAAIRALDGTTALPAMAVVDATPDEARRLVERLVTVAPGVRVIVLGVREVEADVLHWVETGVDGYVPREASIEELGETLDAVAQGWTLCSPAIAAVLMRRVARVARERRSSGPVAQWKLTHREREIADLIDAGLTNKEIARRLQIELPTVKNHVHNLLQKVGATRRGEAAALLRAHP